MDFSSIEAVINEVTASKITTAVKAAAGTNWSALHTEIKNHDWLHLGATAIEDLFEIAKPWVPQAGAAQAVVKLTASLIGSAPQKGQKVSIKQFLEAVSAAEGIDWQGLHTALMGNGPFLAGVTFADDVAKIISPFVPQAALAEPFIHTLVGIVGFGKPAQVEDPSMQKAAGTGSLVF